MLDIDAFVEGLGKHVMFSKARLKLFALLVFALWRGGSVRLSELALRIGGEAKPESSYRRLQNFFASAPFDYGQIAMFLIAHSGCALGKIGLALDRTHWKFGKTPHNLLVLSLLVGDTAIPLFWVSLGKDGNSSCDERIALMRRALAVLPAERIAYILADREFIGAKYLQWLKDNGIAFVTRVKIGQIATLEDGTSVKISMLFKDVGQGCASNPVLAELAGGLKIWLQAKRTCQGLVAVAFWGNHFESQENGAPEPVNLYRKRWRIECGFACMKTKGFNLEDTHLVHKERIEKLLAIVAAAFLFAINLAKNLPPPPLKNHGYRANCMFSLAKKHIVAHLSKQNPTDILDALHGEVKDGIV